MRILDHSWRDNINLAFGTDVKKLQEYHEGYNKVKNTLDKLQPVPSDWQFIRMNNYQPIYVYKDNYYGDGSDRISASDLVINYQIDSDTKISVIFSFDSWNLWLQQLSSYLDFKGSETVILMEICDKDYLGSRYWPLPPGETWKKDENLIDFQNVNTPTDTDEREAPKQKEKKVSKFKSGWLHTMFIVQYIQSQGIQKYIQESDIEKFDSNQFHEKCNIFMKMIKKKMRTLFPNTQKGGISHPTRTRYEDRTKAALLQLAQNRNIKQTTQKMKKADLIRLLRRR